MAKELRGVQKAQQREFGRRMQENRRTANQNAEVQQMTELQRQNARAEKLLDQNLETFGVDVSNVGNLNEKLTVLRESYEREMKQEVKRLKAERQEMLDEAKLWYRERMGELREENADLSMRLREEQRRADKAEYSLIVQENEIMEWEADNERKRAAWEQKQAQRNALAIETARQQRDEDIAVAKAVAEKRVQRARDARKMDELKRSIRQNAAQLNQMLLRPSKDKYVQPGLIDAAAQVAKLADMTILNERAVNQLTRLQDRIRQSAGSENSPNAMTEEWKQTGVDTLIQTLRDNLQTTKDAKLTKLHEQLAEAEALPDSEKAWALQERLRKRIKETENRTYLPMTVDQMRMLKAITSSTLHVIRNANKTVSLAKAEEVSQQGQSPRRKAGRRAQSADKVSVGYAGRGAGVPYAGRLREERPDGKDGPNAERRPVPADEDHRGRRKAVCQRDRKRTREGNAELCRPGRRPCGRGPDRCEGKESQADPCTAVQFVHAPAQHRQPEPPDERRTCDSGCKAVQQGRH